MDVRSKNRISIPSFVRRSLAINRRDMLNFAYVYPDKILLRGGLSE